MSGDRNRSVRVISYEEYFGIFCDVLEGQDTILSEGWVKVLPCHAGKKVAMRNEFLLARETGNPPPAQSNKISLKGKLRFAKAFIEWLQNVHLVGGKSIRTLRSEADRETNE